MQDISENVKNCGAYFCSTDMRYVNVIGNVPFLQTRSGNRQMRNSELNTEQELVLVSSCQQNIKSLALALSLDRPVLLCGPTGIMFSNQKLNYSTIVYFRMRQNVFGGSHVACFWTKCECFVDIGAVFNLLVVMNSRQKDYSEYK